MLVGIEGGVHGKLQCLPSLTRQYSPEIPMLERIQSISLSTAYIYYSWDWWYIDELPLWTVGVIVHSHSSKPLSGPIESCLQLQPFSNQQTVQMQEGSSNAQWKLDRYKIQ